MSTPTPPGPMCTPWASVGAGVAAASAPTSPSAAIDVLIHIVNLLSFLSKHKRGRPRSRYCRTAEPRRHRFVILSTTEPDQSGSSSQRPLGRLSPEWPFDSDQSIKEETLAIWRTRVS